MCKYCADPLPTLFSFDVAATDTRGTLIKERICTLISLMITQLYSTGYVNFDDERYSLNFVSL